MGPLASGLLLSPPPTPHPPTHLSLQMLQLLAKVIFLADAHHIVFLCCSETCSGSHVSCRDPLAVGTDQLTACIASRVPAAVSWSPSCSSNMPGTALPFSRGGADLFSRSS